MTGAERIVAALLENEVEVVFGLPGVHNLALWEALRESPVRLVGVRHEQSAAYAADGYARATGRVGVALTTTGPGAANAVGATGEANASRSPVVVIATDIPSGLRAGSRRGALHETEDQASLFTAVTAATLHGVRPREAIALALHEQRPVYLEVPTDQLRAPADPESFDAPAREPATEGDPAGLIARAQRPLIWAGRHAVDDGEAIGALAARIGAPILTAYGARGVLPPDHPWLVGLPPHVPAAGALWDDADLVLLIGDDPDGMNTQNWAMPQPPTVVSVGPEKPRNYRVDAHTSSIDPEWRRRHEPPFEKPAYDPPPREAAWLRAVPSDALVLADMCIPGYWLAGFHRVSEPRGFLYPVGWGTLGWAFPASLGASMSGRSAPVLTVCGDGGFLFACGELATIVQERLPTTTLIWDDGGYGMLRYDQDKAGEPRFGVDLVRPDFVALAQSFGLRAEHSDENCADALRRHLDDPEPSVLVVEAEALTPPPTTSPNWYRKR